MYNWLSYLIILLLLCYHPPAFQVVPRDTCVPCGGSTVLNCTTIAPVHLVDGTIQNGPGGQMWRIQHPDGRNLSLCSNKPGSVPAGYELISPLEKHDYYYTGLRLFDTNSTWNGTTFQCIALDVNNHSLNDSAAAVTLEVGSECRICV